MERDVGRSARWASLLTAGALALAGCGSSGSVKAGPQRSSTPASVAGPTSRSQPTAQSSSASPHLTGPVTFRPVLWTSTQGLPTPAPSADSEARALTALAALDCPQP